MTPLLTCDDAPRFRRWLVAFAHIVSVYPSTVTVMEDFLIALVAQIPALLLFLLNLRTSNREATDRQAERDASKEAREQELTMKKLELEESKKDDVIRAREAERQKHRDRYVRFLRAAQAINQHFLAFQQVHDNYAPPEPLRAELSASYEDALLDAGQVVAGDMEAVKVKMDRLVQQRTMPAPGQVADVEALMKTLRENIRIDLEYDFQ